MVSPHGFSELSAYAAASTLGFVPAGDDESVDECVKQIDAGIKER